MKRSFLIAGVLISLIFSACKKQDDFNPVDVSEYFPLEVGKYIVYDLDSLVVIEFGKKFDTINYQAKFVTEEKFTDVSGREVFRIVRYLRKTPANAWVPDNTFQAVNTGSKVEFVESDNLRFIKLSNPTNQDFSWKGNAYVSLNENTIFYKDWDYVYDSVNTSITVGSLNIDSTITVHQRDEILGNPNTPSSYNEYNYSTEKYAKGIGMVYRSFVHMIYQPPPGDPDEPNYNPNDWSYEGYGITLKMIEHN